MISSYLKIILRLASRNKVSAAFSVLSIAIGIGSFIVVAIYVRKELSYDRFHDKPENLYRIVTNVSSPEESFSNAQSTPILIPSVKEQLPGITASTRLFKYRSDVVVVDVSTNTSYTESDFLWADPDVFRVFTIPLIKGTPSSLSNPKTVFISESTAKKYFADSDPIGKKLNNVTFTEFEVAGVFKDLPDNSHFKADFICSLITLKELWGEGTMNNWYNSFLYSYIRINSPSTATSVEQQLNLFLNQHIQLPAGNRISLALQPLTEIHLSSDLMNELAVNGNKMYVYILSAVGVLILLVSMINFVNLGIARSEQRSKEIGVRKVLGSSKKSIFKQVITENTLYGLAAFLVGIGLIQIFLPYINRALGSNFKLTSMDYVSVAVGFCSVVLVVLVTSLYPAIFMAGLKTVEVLKGKPVQLGKGINVWKALMVFQMSITLFLLIACFVLNTQLNFLQSKPLGYQIEHVLNIPLLTDSSQKRYEKFKDRLLQHSVIQSASATSHLIGGPLYQSGYTIFKSNHEKASFAWQRIHADYDYVKTNNLKIIAGRDFSETFRSDSLNFIINEAACKALGLISPSQAIGLNVDQGQGKMGSIIGVISDFHFKSLQNLIEPLVIHYQPGRFRFLSVSIKNSVNLQNAINIVKSEWNQFEPGAPFVYSFPDEFTKELYSFEKNLWLLITIFTIIAFTLSIAGLVGLSYYITRLKAKEIGIRKVLGASTESILRLFSMSFVKMSLIAMMVAFPVAWWAMYSWLEDFAYRVSLDWWLFAIAGIIVMVTALGTIGFQSVKAALTNPLRTLRTE